MQASDDVTTEECRTNEDTGIQKRKPVYFFFKRLLDILFSLVVLVLFLPIWLIVSLFVIIDTKSTPLYIQQRVGKHGKLFNIYKFRTMVKDSENVEKYLHGEDLEVWKRERKVDHDPRITTLGRILRKTSIDEVPNFMNVLMGSMSIVGPRPITVYELNAFGEKKDKFLSVRPGITGWWQVVARNEADFESGSRQKLELFYCDNASFSLDLRIFFKTFVAVFSGNGK